MNGADAVTAASPLLQGRLGPAMLLTLASATRGNALDMRLLELMEAAISALIANGDASLVLDAEGDKFCVGMDLAEVAALAAASHGTRGLHEAFARVLARLGDVPALSIALVDGEALGGGLALAAACDVVIATDRARFGLPEALWGLLPANAGPLVARRIGLHAARRLALTTETVPVDEAHRLGLIDIRATDRVAALGIARRLCLRADRVGCSSVAAVKDCFGRLAGDPADYRAWALETISVETDSAALQQRLAASAGERQ
jgi:polyketide biosynthesis enoyl-CoA hydratase PksH